MIETAMPYLREVGAGPCRQAAALIEQIRSKLVLDFQLTAEGSERRN